MQDVRQVYECLPRKYAKLAKILQAHCFKHKIYTQIFYYLIYKNTKIKF